jgi:pyruvate kinase
MVARGDLGVEVGDAELVGIQKRIIQQARTLNKFVITATQMMESMISSPMPTRAEVSDVANAVLDHTDAVMLSAETASGDYPVEAVQAMARICLGAEKHPTTTQSHHRLGERFERCDETIALSAMYAANHHPKVRAIIALTKSGHTPLIMSRIRSAVPIFAFTPHFDTLNRVAMYRSVQPMPFEDENLAPEKVYELVIAQLRQRNIVAAGDRVVITKGDARDVVGGTNSMKILTVD